MIFNLLNKKEQTDENINLVKIIALLIHAAKIDEHYSEKEKKNNYRFYSNATKFI